MGATVGGLAFLPPARTLGELKELREHPNFLLVPGGGDSEDMQAPIAALHFDCGALVTVLYSHGNAEDLIDVQDKLRMLSQELEVNVLGYDYQSYGLTQGECDEAACFRAVRACFAHLLQVGADPDSIVLMGRSLGSGPTVELAMREPGIAGVVLQSPLLSVLRTALSASLARASWLRKADLFENAEKISAVSCPVFVLHGTDDRIVPHEHGVEIGRLAPNAVRHWWVEGRGHNDLHHHGDYYKKLAEFVLFAEARQRRRKQETIQAFARNMMVLTKPSEKLLITAM
jgi:fermentation-respiration switch protein FrsA (DUF1100 family)